MSKWSDPDILAQLQELDREKRASKTKRQTAFDAAMDESHEHGLSDNPAYYIPARLMTVMLPVFEGLDNAARTQDTDAIVKMVNGLAMAIAIAMLQTAATSRLPDYLLDVLQELVDRDMAKINAESKALKGKKS